MSPPTDSEEEGRLSTSSDESVRSVPASYKRRKRNQSSSSTTSLSDPIFSTSSTSSSTATYSDDSTATLDSRDAHKKRKRVKKRCKDRPMFPKMTKKLEEEKRRSRNERKNEVTVTHRRKERSKKSERKRERRHRSRNRKRSRSRSRSAGRMGRSPRHRRKERHRRHSNGSSRSRSPKESLRTRGHDADSNNNKHSNNNDNNRNNSTYKGRNIIKCKICDVTKLSLKGLVHHEINCHSLGVKCHLCLTTFDKKEEWRAHYEEEHNDSMVQCVFCKSMFETAQKMSEKRWEFVYQHIYGEILYSRLAEYEESKMDSCDNPFADV